MFNETRIDPQISYYAVGGRRFQTTFVQTYGGDTFANAAWSIGLGEWEIASALRSTNPHNTYAYRALRNLFYTSLGGFGGFRMRDWKDFQDEGGGIWVMLDATHFQAYKRVTLNGVNYDQIVNKPVQTDAQYGNFTIVGGSVASMDYTTGIVTMTSGTPTSWTGTYDIPVRFADDSMGTGMGPDQSAAYYEAQQVKLVEIRNP